MKRILTLFALLLILGLAARMGALDPVQAWLLDHKEEVALSEAQVRATLNPEVFTIDTVFDAFNRLPSPWAAIAKGGFFLLCGLLVLSLIGAVLRVFTRTLDWLRDLVA